MPYDLFPEVEREAMSRARMNTGIGDASFGAGFFKGAGMYAMRGFAETARGVDLLGALPLVAMDKLTGGTERSDQYFSEHDAVFDNAVDYWTPRPGEVGAAGQIVGSLAGNLPQIIISPALAVGTASLGSAEDLTKAGVGTPTAIGVGTIQGAALAAGIRLPFLGKTIASRMASGAIGNLAVNTGATAASAGLLKATGNEKEAEGFNPFDLTQRSVDILMGVAFGGLAHLDAKAQAAHRAMLDEDVKAAILVLNQSKRIEAVANSQGSQLPEHLNVKVNALQQAVEQALRGDAVTADREVKPLMATTPEATRAWQEQVHAEAAQSAKAMLNEVALRNAQIEGAEAMPGFLRTPEQMLALKAGKVEAQGSPEMQRAIEISNKPGFLRTAEERIFLDGVMSGEAFDHLKPIEKSPTIEPKAQEGQQRAQPEVKPAAGPAKEPPTGGGGAAAEAVKDPIVETARSIATDMPDLRVPTGEVDADGRPNTMPVADFLAKAQEMATAKTADAGLFRTALTCLLGSA